MIQRPADWLTETTGRRSRATALHYAGSDLSYLQLDRQVTALCRLLVQAAVGPGDTLALASSSALLCVLMVHAAQRQGFSLFPLRPQLSDAVREALLMQAGVDRLAVDAPGVRRGAGSVVPPFTIDNRPSRQDGGVEQAVGGRSNVWLLLATSGSSGEPKPVMLTEPNLAANVASANRVLGLGSGDCWLACLPLFHIGGLAVPLRCVVVGAKVVLHERFEPERVLRDLKAQRVTHLSLVPAMLARLLELSGDRPVAPHLRVVLTGGGGLSPALAERAHEAGWPVCVTYGMTETASQVTIDCSADAGVVAGRVGRPSPGVKLRCEGAEPGAPGRIWVAGGALMAGYANPRQLPGSGLQGGWFETGDLGCLGADGVLHLLGRADDRLVSGGETVHPAEVENMLRVCPGLDEVLVSARRDEVWGERLVAVYVGSITEQEAERRVRGYLRGVFRPREFIRVRRLPVADRDKPDRKRLRQWLSSVATADH